MKKFPKFYEYLDQKGKLIEKPKEEEIPDYHGDQDAAPQKPVTKGRKWDAEYAKPLKDAQKPYRAPGKDMSMQQSLGKEDGPGLVGQGDKRLVYNPSLKGGSSKNINGGKELSGWDKKTKTEQFINKTKDMSFQEFTTYMRGLTEIAGGAEDLPMVTAYTAGKFHPHPPEAMQYVVSLASKNDRILEQLIYAMKKQGMLGKLLKTMMEHPETSDELTKLLGDEADGPRHCRGLARAMHKQHTDFLDKQNSMYESVAPPFGEDDDEYEAPEGEGEAGELDEKPGEGGEEGAPEGEEQPEGEEGQPEEEEGQPEEEEEQPDDEVPPEDEEGKDQPPPQEKPRKLKKKFSHHNLLDALSNFEHMRDAMRAY